MNWEAEYPSTTTVWITALTGNYTGLLVEKLMEKGYVVSSAHTDGRPYVTVPNSVSAVIALVLYSKNKNITSHMVKKDVRECLFNIRAFYYSIVSMSFLEVSWEPGNIVIQTEPANLPTKPKSKSHLRLIKNETSDKPTA